MNMFGSAHSTASIDHPTFRARALFTGVNSETIRVPNIDARDLEAIPSVLHENFTFGGSLGEKKRGWSGFAEYVVGLHEALGDYRCVIEDLVAEGDKVFAKMTFGGAHRAEFMGYPRTGRWVTWAGCALFTFRGERIADV